MKNRNAIVLATVVLSSAALLAGCGGSDTAAGSSDASVSAAPSSSASESSGSGAGFEEIPIGDDHELGPLNVAMVFFQPVDMWPEGMGVSAADASFHLEADIHALKGNKLGYETGQYVPDLTVDYVIADKSGGKTVASGTFMQMNASDGPHYGANIKLDKAGEYTVKLTIKSPESKGWMLHVDKETGVTGRFWTTPLTGTWDWDYTPHEW